MNDDKSVRSSRLLLYSLPVILLLFICYAAALIWFSSFTLYEKRWFSLFDDAMISMRYAWNLTHGHGLNWNSGERVEGITNPGWTFIMAAIHLLENRLNFTSLYVQIVSATSLVGTVVLTGLLCLRVGSGSPVAAVMASLAVAFYFPLNFFSLMGMETGLLALLLTAAVFLIVSAERSGKRSIIPWLLLALAVTVRLDSVVPLVAIGIAALLAYPQNRGWYIILSAASLIGAVGLQTGFRYWYYGELLPNTYYLKMTDVPLPTRLGRGIWVSGQYIYSHIWPFYLFVPLLLTRYFKDRSSFIQHLRNFPFSSGGILTTIVSAQLAYSTYVGGDVWEKQIYANRFLVIVEPLVFILLAQAFVACIQTTRPGNLLLTRYPLTAAWTLALLAVVQTNCHAGYEFARDQAMLRLSMPHVMEARGFVRASKILQETIPPEMTIALDRAGTLPYFMPNFRFFDVLGKTDPVIARGASHFLYEPHGSILNDSFVPGHTKWDASHTIGKHKPDLLLLTVGFMSKNYDPWIDRHYSALSVPGIFGTLFIRKEHQDTIGASISATASQSSTGKQ